MRIASIVCCTVFVLCLLSLPVIDYAGGRSCMPLSVPPFFPALIVPVGIGFVAVVTLAAIAIKSFGQRKQRNWAIWALIGIVLATTAFVLTAAHLPGFLHGLRDRFVAEVGYAQMRELAKEVSQNASQLAPYGMIQRPWKWGPVTEAEQKRWDELASRYPFLNRTRLSSEIMVQDGIVEVSWGGALIGLWGFRVSPDGAVPDLDTKRWRVLRVADDIQFFYGE